MKAYIVTYLRKNNTKVQVLVLRDADMLKSDVMLWQQVAATDEEYLAMLGIEPLTESVVVALN